MTEPDPPGGDGGLWTQAGEQLRDLAVLARARLRAVRDGADPTLRRARDLAARGNARLHDFAAWLGPLLQALREGAAEARSRLGELTSRALAQLRRFAAWARPYLQALRDLAARALVRLRRFAAWALVRLRELGVRALPWLRALRNLLARALRWLGALTTRAMRALSTHLAWTLQRGRDLAARALVRGWALSSVAARMLLRLVRSVPPTAVVLAAIVTISFLMFVLTEPAQRWILLLGVLAAALGTHGVLRSERPRTFELGADTTPQLVLPALYALAIPLFIEENARGLWVPLCALAAGLGFAAIVVAEIRSAREFERGAAEARLVADAGAYLTAFALLSLLYTREPSLPAAVAVAALVGGLLSFEVLRNSSLGRLDMLTFALVGALVIGELRWALHFMPLDGHLAAVALLLAFFFVSGVLAARLRGQLTREVLIQYSALAAIGVVVVTAARAADLA